MKYVPISPAFSQKEPEWPKKIFPCTQRMELEDEAVEMGQRSNL